MRRCPYACVRPHSYSKCQYAVTSPKRFAAVTLGLSRLSAAKNGNGVLALVGKPSGLLGTPVCKQSISRKKEPTEKEKAQSKPGYVSDLYGRP